MIAMAKRVVVHHAHHADEKVYRLIHAQRDEVTQYVEVENPNYDPDAAVRLRLGIGQYEKPNRNGGRPVIYIDHGEDEEGNALGGEYVNGDGVPVLGAYDTPPDFDPEIHSPTKMEERIIPVYSDHQDIVWADWDDTWKGLSDDEIAAKQRQIVRDVIDAREREQMEAAQKAQQNVRHIGEAEVEF